MFPVGSFESVKHFEPGDKYRIDFQVGQTSTFPFKNEQVWNKSARSLRGKQKSGLVIHLEHYLRPDEDKATICSKHLLVSKNQTLTVDLSQCSQWLSLTDMTYMSDPLSLWYQGLFSNSWGPLMLKRPCTHWSCGCDWHIDLCWKKEANDQSVYLPLVHWG